MKNLLIIVIVFILLISNLFSNEWIDISKIPTGRSLHKTAYNHITNELVLFGGFDGGLKNDTWVYDINASKWIKKYPQNAPSVRTGHSFSHLTDDKYILFGGIGENEEYYADTWIYDLSDNEWTQIQTEDSPSARAYHQTCNLTEGNVLLFGGSGEESNNNTWLFQFNQMNWVLKNSADMPEERMLHSLSYISDKKALLFGGRKEKNDFLNDMWIFDLNSNKWEKKETLIVPEIRSGHSSCFIENNKVIVFGGVNYSKYMNDTWIYDLSENNWEYLNLDSKPDERCYQDMVYIGNSKFIMTAGQVISLNLHYYNDIWELDLDNKKWTELENNVTVIPPYFDAEMSYLSDNKLVLHGSGLDKTITGTFIFDYHSKSWQNVVTSNIPLGRGHANMCHITAGKTLYFGGRAFSNDVYLNDTWLFDESKMDWEKLDYSPINPPPRSSHAMSYIDDKFAVIFGGLKGNLSSDNFSNDLWLYDLENYEWRKLSEHKGPSPRINSSMCYIDKNKVLLFGGDSEEGLLNDTWIYDLKSNIWTELNIANSPPVRNFHQITYIGGDKALLTCGSTGGQKNSLNDMWIFDLSENSWTELKFEIKPRPRSFHEAVSFFDNRLLLLGGVSYSGNTFDRFSDLWLFEKDNLPIVKTIDTNDITNFSIICTGEILDDGYSDIINQGFVWSTKENANLVENEEDHIVRMNDNQKFTELIEGLAPETEYYIRAFAENESGIAYGNEIKFKTLQAIEKPKLISPEKDAIHQKIDVDFEWTAIPKAESYDLSYSADPDFIDSVVVRNITESNLLINNMDYNTKYYWKVRQNQGANKSTWSDTWFFTTEFEHNAPDLIKPENFSKIDFRTIDFEWIQVEGMKSYIFQLSEEYLFQESIIDDTLSNTSHTINDLEVGIKYYWRVGTLNFHDETEWSKTYEFTAINVSSVKEISNDVIQIVPNPSRDYISIVGLDYYKHLEIYDLKGEMLLKTDFTDKIDVSSLTNGAYVIKIYTNDNIYTKKLMIE